MAAGLGALAIGGYNLISIANDGNGTVALAWGIFVTVGGALLLAAGFALLPDDRPVPDQWPTLPATVELLIMAVALGVLMFTVVAMASIRLSMWWPRE